MSQGRWVASSELEGPGVQPQVREQGRGVDSAHPERGLERAFLRKGSFTHADFMGTSQQLNSPTTRKGETLDMIAVRETISTRPVTVRPSSNNGGGNGPPVVTTLNTARGLSRPSAPPASYGSMLSPRTHHSTSYGSYRDVALAAAQHGLSAYAQSAAAAMIRGHTPRSGGSTAAVATPGRPPPAPRPTQHSAPTPMANAAPNGPVGEFLPSCGVGPPISGSVPASRGLSFQPSRCSAPSPNSPGRGDVSASATSGSVTSHRSGGDVAVVTVTYNDVWWRGAFEGSVEPDDPLAGGGGGLSVGATGAIRVMSPGWGAAPPSVCEADGRPGTRGGGPLFDIEGRPTTRSGQRPPSRALLNLSQHRPPAHVAPLGAQGWPNLFAGGCNTASGEALIAATASLPPSYSPSPRAPSAGTSISWSGDATEPPGSHRRQLVPLTPPIPGSAAAARLSSPQARGFGNGSSGVAGPGGVLTSLVPPSNPVGSAPVTSPHSPQGLPPPATSPTQRLAAAGGGAWGVGSSSSSSSSSSNSLATSVCVGSGSGGGSGGGGGGGGTRAQLTSKLSSIAEVPGSPVLLPLPPQPQPQQQPQPQPQQQKQPSKSPAASARMADGVNMGGRKAPRERGAGGFLAAFLGDGTDAEQSPFFPSMFSEEGLIDDSRRSNTDQNSGSCGTDLVSRGHDGGSVSGDGNVTMTGTVNGGGRARPRRSSSNTLTAGAGTSSYLRGHGSLTPDLTGWLQGPSESASQTDETPSNRPRR
ncbi:hypothetical protein Vafri_1256 [Volvox africanus]|nr:hypothetical protein Vafri_1256 [Volvox africanus]